LSAIQTDSHFPMNLLPPLHCCPSESLRTARVLDCGGRAQRRHRFWAAAARYKAAWRFASRRTPKTPGCGFAALRPSRPLRETLRPAVTRTRRPSTLRSTATEDGRRPQRDEGWPGTAGFGLCIPVATAAPLHNGGA
jgi:hypothetical protein